MSSENQLDRIETKLDRVEAHLARLNGQVSRHSQTLYGVEGRGGLIDDIKTLTKDMERFTPGMTSVKTVWAAVASISAVAAVIVSLTLGLT